jgi:peptide/nickel transport system permease protein
VGAYLLGRLAGLVPVLIGLSLIVFLIMALIPGDPALAILGPYATPDSLARVRAELGLDRSLPVQYAAWLGHVLAGDLGRSHSLNRPVLDEVGERFAATLVLAGAALVLAALIGLLVGIVAAVRQGGTADRLATLAVLVGISMPSFWLGLLLILLVSVRWRLLPVSGMYAITGGEDLSDLLAHLVLPAVTLAVVAAGVIARLTRSAMLEVLRQDFVRTARAKGVPERRIIVAHALKAALVTVIPVIGIQAGFVLGGAVSIATRDVLLVQGGVLVVATAYVLFNLAADLLQRLLDPRIGA